MIHQKYIFTYIPKKGNPAETKYCQNPLLPVASPFRSTLTMGSLQGFGRGSRINSQQLCGFALTASPCDS
jgi:hypothetical protein